MVIYIYLVRGKWLCLPMFVWRVCVFVCVCLAGKRMPVGSALNDRVLDGKKWITPAFVSMLLVPCKF